MMSIDPRWLKEYQKRIDDTKQAIDDWVLCAELEELMEEPFDE